MRKNILSLSIAAMIGGLAATGASAAVLATAAAGSTLSQTDTGTGHILVVPYFTTNSNNATLINITNTDTVNGKAVKVRFRGASNSDDIFDFQVYLSPGDVWTANVHKRADGLSELATSDKSCTLPASVNAPFDTSRLPSTMTAAQKAAETNEGYIEILNMADVPKALQAGQFSLTPATTNNPLYDATKHVAGVPPCTSGVMGLLATDPGTATSASAAGTAGTESPAAASTLGLTAPTGQLMVNWAIVNTVATTSFSGQAYALTAIGTASASAPVAGNIVFSPQLSTGVSAAAIAAGTADPLFQTTNTNITVSDYATAPLGTTLPYLTARQYDLPDLSTPYVAGNATPQAQAANITAKFATKAVVNEYLSTPGLSANTDWTFTSATRRYLVAYNYNVVTSAAITDGRVFANAASGNIYFTNANTVVQTSPNSMKQICVSDSTLVPKSYDREEVTSGSSFVISPGTVTNAQFCGEASVLSINAGGTSAVSVLGSSLARQDLTLPANEGWLRIATATVTGNGLPVIGNAFIKAIGNGQNYGITWGHRFSR